MRVLEDLKFTGEESITREEFENLPDRAKELLILILGEFSRHPPENYSEIMEFMFYGMEECESPIEKILNLSLWIVSFLREEEFGSYHFFFEPQVEYGAYRADFSIQLIEPLNPNAKECIFLVECDGHKYHHSTPAQVKRDNERDYALKMLGYEVLRFSGSQIYQDPLKCANDIVDYAISKIQK